MLVARISAHWTARNLDGQEPDRLAAALAQLGITEPQRSLSATPSSDPTGATGWSTGPRR